MIKRKPIGAVILALCVLSFGIVISFGIVSLVRNYDRPPLPALEEIASISIKWCRSDANTEATFAVPKVSKECWNDLIDALSPYYIDKKPCNWQVLGDMELETKAGRVYALNLYTLKSDAVGAFSIQHDPQNTSRTYYRGGNSIQLEKAIKMAYDKSIGKHQ